MNGILGKILAKKRIETEAEMLAIPAAEVERAALAAPKPPSFRDALAPSGGIPAVIAELKKASPSMGLIRADFRPEELAPALESAGASALSVLTEREFFMGGPECLSQAASLVKIPVLRKDFIYCEYQLLQARALGASAALLIAAMLKKTELERLARFAKSLGLDALVETHTEGELECALECGAEIIGVNSRNLKTFEFDFSLFERLLSKIPEGARAVAESGMETREALERAAECGAHAALVGTALMSAKNPAKKLERMLGGK